MHRFNKITLLSVGGLALVGAFMLLLSSISPTPTPRAEAAANDGSLAGVYDIIVNGGGIPAAGGTGLYLCIGKVDHDTPSNALSGNLVCYADIDLGDPNGEPGSILPCEGGSPPAVGDVHDDDADGTVNDGCPPAGPPIAETVCTGSADEDGDTLVNDGCPRVGTAEVAGANCSNSIDNDADTFVNDGCAAGGPGAPESGLQCAAGDTVDDDSDGSVNDGCTAVSTAESALTEGPNLVVGPPPPPPYTTLPPQDSTGVYAPGSDTAVISACFSDVGGTTAPNIIAVTTLVGAKADLGPDGIMSGSVFVNNDQPNAACATNTATPTQPGSALPVHFLRVATKAGTAGAACGASPYVGPVGPRSAHCIDFDGDGCTDLQEVTLPTPAGCGDDPFNPYDSIVTSLTGSYSVNAIATPEKCSNEPSVAGPCVFGAEAESGVNCAIGNVTDNDTWEADGTVNDGCPVDNASENLIPANCSNATDDDGDGRVNDGCPKVGAAPEVGAACLDAVDQNTNDTAAAPGEEDDDGDATHNEAVDDGDGGAVNDGCPGFGLAETVCTGSADEDGDTKANDGCPAVGGAPNPSPGAFYGCLASFKDPGGAAPRAIPIRIYCYIDIPGLVINAEAFPGCSGDGLPGASPPGIIDPDGNGPIAPTCGGVAVFGDMDAKHSALTGALNAASDSLHITGCLEDLDSMGALGNVYIDATVNPRTGNGTAKVYGLQAAACAGSPIGAVPPDVTIQLARQSNNLSRDSDNDGCSDAEELADNQAGQPHIGVAEAFGGLRDPLNQWDFFDTNGDKVVDLFTDIFGVAFDFGGSGSKHTDRGAQLIGSSAWNIPGPDGIVDLFNDIFDAAFQFGHDCTGAP
jgi:hypothetical protein